PLGGLLLGLTAALAFGATAVLYLATVLALLALPAPGERSTAAAAPGPGGVFRDIRAGLSFLVSHRTLFVYAVGVGLLNLAWAAVYAALPVFALRPGPLELSSSAYGGLLMIAGVSGLAVGLLSATATARLGNRLCMTLGLAGMSAGFCLPGFLPTTPALGIGMGCTGLLVLVNVVTVSYRQRTVP
ncbi:MFS transporter, partial [Streptomyces sp. TRM76130]|nr:MFS transporter [Streptomyces sp. TRM76130]